ncbi:NAD(P)-dependent oxidoreductase [Streptosporangium sp. NPDC051022]|uniref:NAD(P)-dependent oxidoreductase n=1 Tax=Streptosporangium sp. NPDC051022 TaxID=3155752 RepID=UPI00342CF6F7
MDPGSFGEGEKGGRERRGRRKGGRHMRVAVLGMGRMGGALARRLLARGHTVRVWNRTPGKAGELVEAGAVEAASPLEAARDADGVLMSLADDRASREVMAQLAGLGEVGAAAPVVADASTVSPATSRGLRETAPGHRFVAAPILGGPEAVVGGHAMGLLGGEREYVRRLDPVWRDLFGVQRYCGDDPGAALTYKLLNNYLLMSGLAVVAEAVATGQAAGLDDSMLHDFLFRWPTVAPALHNRLEDVLHGDHRGWFTTRLGAKDVRLVAELAESAGLDLPIARLVQRLYEKAAEHGWGDADIAAIVELLRERPGDGAS